jgi:hypothetical protein
MPPGEELEINLMTAQVSALGHAIRAIVGKRPSTAVTTGGICAISGRTRKERPRRDSDQRVRRAAQELNEQNSKRAEGDRGAGHAGPAWGQYSWAVFSPQGPSVGELAVQALSSVEGGYDLLAPKFDRTPFRTCDGVLDAAAGALRPFGPFGRGLDVCCGTGAGMRVLRSRCAADRSPAPASALACSRRRAARTPAPAGYGPMPGRCPSPRSSTWRSASGRSGTSCPPDGPPLFAGVYRALRPGGVFAVPVVVPPPVTSGRYWALLGFDLAIRVRNAAWRPPFVMYYRTCPPGAVRRDLAAAGFTVTTVPVTAAGAGSDGNPRCLLVLARKPGTP